MVSIPSIVCFCGNQYQPDYTTRCDTKEITWSLSQTTETEETSQLYTMIRFHIIKYELMIVLLEHIYTKKKRNVRKYITPHFSIYRQTLSFSDLDQTTSTGNYWLEVTGLNYEDDVYGDGSLSHNDIWFQFNVVE